MMEKGIRWADLDLSGLKNQTAMLWGMVRKFTGNPLLMDFLSQLIEAYQVPSRDLNKLSAAIRDYSANYIKFFREYPERFASPMRTIVWGLGDCDDKAIFVAAALRSFRIPTRLILITLTIDGKKVRHVYPEAYLDDKWVPMESVRPFPWAHDPSKVAKKKGMLHGKEIIGDKEDSGKYA